MLIKSIRLNNILSFGEGAETIELENLNLIIGPNGAGKSNLLEAVSLLQAAPRDLLAPIRDGGGVRDWLWKGGEGTPQATINTVFAYPPGGDLRHLLAFTEIGQRFSISEERIERAVADSGHFFYRFENGSATLNLGNTKRQLQHEDIDPAASILAQRKDPDQYPELTWLGNMLGKIRLYREWGFGRYTAPRLPQKADLPNEVLQEDGRNLGLVLNRLRREPAVKKRILSALQAVYEGIDDFDVQIEGGTVQVFLHEGRFAIPATRLSDGTLRYLCLLAILCHPLPGPLICIEEPELGLHPDVLPSLANLLREAANHTQLIVTTHSDVLVDAMSDTPDCVLVAEKNADGTQMRRLDAVQLKPWLEKYSLGQLWTRGEIGGTRW